MWWQSCISDRPPGQLPTHPCPIHHRNYTCYQSHSPQLFHRWTISHINSFVHLNVSCVSRFCTSAASQSSRASHNNSFIDGRHSGVSVVMKEKERSSAWILCPKKPKMFGDVYSELGTGSLVTNCYSCTMKRPLSVGRNERKKIKTGGTRRKKKMWVRKERMWVQRINLQWMFRN